MIDLLQSDDPFKPKIKGRIEQGGIGVNSFCESCNNFLGIEYVNAYFAWVMTGEVAINQGDFIGHDYTAKGQLPNKILKQIISMFLGINTVEFSENNKELSHFVRNPDSKELDERFQVFTYLNTKGIKRYIPLTAVGNIKTAENTLCSEITFPPFGFVLTVNSEIVRRDFLINITNFKTREPESKYDVDLKINKLETHLPIPMDYRTKAEIEDAMKNGR